MFGVPETLIIVYKDEMLANQIKKLIETKDDTEDSVTGTTDNSINIVSWSEKIWLDNKKAGNITSKVLFLGNIKGVDKLIPVIDTKYNKFGIHYGWAGNQAVIYAEPNEIKAIAKYRAFYEELEKSIVPQTIKDILKPKTLEVIEPATEEIIEESVPEEKALFINKSKAFFKKAKTKIEERYTEISHKAQDFTEENFKNKKALEQQMLFYGVVQLYNNDLECFMNS